MSYTLILLVLVFVVLLVFTRRSKQKQAAQAAQRAETMVVGAQVMTTSGLYGTVVARNDDETVQLSIAPGVEVKWSMAALRDMASLPDQFRTRDTPSAGPAPEQLGDPGRPPSGGTVDLGKRETGDGSRRADGEAGAA